MYDQDDIECGTPTSRWGKFVLGEKHGLLKTLEENLVIFHMD
jgi:hypothetical protein